MKKDALPYLLATAICAVVLAILFGSVVTLQYVPGSPDSVTPMALGRALDALRAKSGHYPLWGPWTFSGMPTVEAFSYLSGLYLPNLLFGFLRLDPLFIQLLHLLFAGLGGFALARRLGLGSMAAFLSGSAFMLNPFLTAMFAYGHGSQLMTTAWMPWVLWAGIRLTEKGRIADAGLLALFLGLQLQRAHVQIAWYTWMVMVPLLVVKLLFDARPGVSKAKSGWLALIALLLGVAVALQVYLPALGYLPASSRSGAGDPLEAYSYATLWSMHPAELFTYMMPGAFGFGGIAYWGFMPFTDFPHYAGLVVLGLAIVGVTAGRSKPMVLFLAAATLLSLLLSFGSFFSPVFDLFYRFAPMFRSFRVPSMVLIVVDLCLALLAGYGLQAWLDKPLSDKSPLFRWVGLAVGVLSLLFLILEGGLEKQIRALFPPVPIDNLDLVSMVANLRWELWSDSLFLLIIGFAIIAGLFWLGAKGIIGAREVAISLLLLSSVDLFRIDQSILFPDERSLRNSPMIERAALAPALEEDEITRFLAGRPGTFRIYPVGRLFTENKFSIAGIESTGGYHAAKLGIYQDMLTRTQNLANLDVLRMLNVAYVLTPEPVEDPALKPVASGTMNLVSGQVPVWVYELAETMPRVWFAPWASAAGSDGAAIDSVMAGKGADGGVFVTGAPWQGVKRFQPGEVLSMQRSAESLTMKVRSDGEGLLVLSEVFYPERWLLSVDGRPQETLKIGGVIRGVQLPAGEHEISFVYDRSRFETGRIVSLLATLLSFALVAGGVVSGRRGTATSTSTLSAKP